MLSAFINNYSRDLAVFVSSRTMIYACLAEHLSLRKVCSTLGFMVALAVVLLASSSQVDLSGGFDLERNPAKIETARSHATVLIFISSVCPIANRYAPEINRIHQDYRSKGVQFYRVYPDSLESIADYTKHAKEFDFKMPALVDPNRKLAKATGVRVTPEVAVLSPRNELLYRGRIDDANIEHGKIRENYRRDLRVALDEILAGQPVSISETAAVGCYIPDSD